jgi:hypothetical protein
MWFNPAELACKQNPPANFANLANKNRNAPQEPEEISRISRISNPSENETKILAWLAHIGEVDPEIIDDVIGRCRDDTDCMAYFLKRSAEML